MKLVLVGTDLPGRTFCDPDGVGGHTSLPNGDHLDRPTNGQLDAESDWRAST